MEDKINDLLNKMSNGNIVLFVGAGFSVGAKTLDDKVTDMPNTEKLTQAIRDVGGFTESEKGDLKDTMDYFLQVKCQNNRNMLQNLIKKLRNIFETQEPLEYHKNILMLPWKRIWTTNYDDLVETAAKSIGKRVETATLNSKLEDNELYCVHINGFIKNLNEETIDKDFKISGSSYIASADVFSKSACEYHFKNDLEYASAIIFIGYSLYDIEIEKVLYKNPNFKDKTYFVQSQKTGDTNFEDFRFNKYGQILRIGVEGFSDIIKENISKLIEPAKEFYTKSLKKYSIEETKNKILRDNQVELFLTNGQLDENFIYQAPDHENQKPPFLVIREQIKDLIENFEKHNIICVLGEIGNGKSIFLKEASHVLNQKGYNVFISTSDNSNHSIIRDFEEIKKYGIQRPLIVIDTYSNFYEIIEYIIKNGINDIKLLLSERTLIHHSIISKEENKKFKTYDIYIDMLNNSEIDHLNKIIDNLGFPEKPRNNELKQISLILMNRKNSEYLKKEINKIFQRLNDKKEILFVICLLNVMDKPLELSLISELLNDRNILSDFKETKDLEHFFTINYKEQEILIKSSIFSSYIIREIFNENDIVDFCIKLSKNLGEKFGALDYKRESIRKNLLRFNFIEQLLKNNKRNMLIRYFEELKNKINYHIDNPQYWLQYAMAHISTKEYDKASRYLENAYEKARNKDRYNEKKIDNQKARLNLKIASEGSITSITEAIVLFKEADTLLAKQENSTYKFKVVSDYKEFFDARKNGLSDNNDINSIKMACKNKLRDLEKIEKDDQDNFKQEQIYNICKNNLSYILNNI